MFFTRSRGFRLCIPGRHRRRTFDHEGWGIAVFVGAVLTAMVIFSRRMNRLALLIEGVAVEDAEELLGEERNNPDFVVLDVRTPSEYERGHLPVAISLNSRSETFRDELHKLDKEKVYLVYSGHGDRSGKAATLMKSLGFRSVFHLQDGFAAWERHGCPVVK